MRLAFGDCIFDSDTREVIRAGKALAYLPQGLRPARAADREPSEGGLQGRHPLAPLAGHATSRKRISAISSSSCAPRWATRRASPASSGPSRASATRSSPRPRSLAAAPGPRLRLRAASIAWSGAGARSRSIRARTSSAGIARRSSGSTTSRSRAATRASRSTRPARRSRTSAARTAPTSAARRSAARRRLSDRDVVKIGPATLTLRVLKRTGSTRSTMKERSSR